MSSEPLIVVRGDDYTWTRSWSEYPRSAGWAATWVWNGAKQVTATGAPDPDDPDGFAVTLPRTLTTDWTVGLYGWGVALELGSAHTSILGGRTEVHPGLLEATGDPRTFSERMLDAIERTLEGKATHDQLSYSLQGTSIARMPPEDLERWRAIYLSAVERERRERERAAGRDVASRSQLLIRM